MKIGFRPGAVAATFGLGLAACGSSSAAGPGGPSPTADPLNGSIAVFAASSLTTTFNGAEAALESHHPGFKADYSYAGSQTLVTQILDGAPADVIVTANTSTMAQLTAKGLVETPQAFCENKLEIITAPGNPKNITSLADLAKPGISVVLAIRAYRSETTRPGRCRSRGSRSLRSRSSLMTRRWWSRSSRVTPTRRWSSSPTS